MVGRHDLLRRAARAGSGLRVVPTIVTVDGQSVTGPPQPGFGSTDLRRQT